MIEGIINPAEPLPTHSAVGTSSENSLEDQSGSDDAELESPPPPQIRDKDVDIVDSPEININKVSPLAPQLDQRRPKHLQVSNESFVGEGSRLWPIPSETLIRIEKLFRPPPVVAKFHAEQRRGNEFRPEKRILLIGGPANSGRYSCALWLGLESLKITRSRRCLEYRPEFSVLDELLRQLDLEQSCVAYIVQNAIPAGARWDGLEEQLCLIADRLKDSYLMMTCPSDVDPSCRHCRYAEFIDLRSSDDQLPEYMSQVVRRYLRFHDTDQEKSIYGIDFDETLRDAIEALENAPNVEQRLSGHLLSPPQVDTFFRRLSKRGPCTIQGESLTSALLRLADDVAVASRLGVREWFLKLPLNHKLYSLLVALFPKINRFLLDELYTHVVKELRGEGVNLYDFREENVELLFELIHVRLQPDESLEFADQRYSDEVQRQLVNYHHLLWSAMPTVCDWIKQFSGPEFWELRQNLGRGIGQMGIHQWPKLQSLLCDMADFEGGYVAVVPGYALQGIIDLARDNSDFNRLGRVLELVRSWANSGNAKRVWAAAAAAWRCYPILARLEPDDADLRGQAHRITLVTQNPMVDRKERIPNNSTFHVSISKSDALQQLEGVLEGVAFALAQLADQINDEPSNAAFVRCYEGLVVAGIRIFDEEPSHAVRLLSRWLNRGEPSVADDASSLGGMTVEKNASPELARSETSGDAAGSSAASQAIVTGSASADQLELDNDTPTSIIGENESLLAEDSYALSNVADTLDAANKRRENTLVHFGMSIATELLQRYRKPEWMEERKHGVLLKLIRPILNLTADDLDETEISEEFFHQYGHIQELVDELMSVVRGWLSNTAWRGRVYGELLRALNRSRFGVRRRFCRNLANEWLKHDDPQIRHIAESLLARAQIIDGFAVDMPGSGTGLICLDGSRAARFNNTGPDAGFQLYERLRAQTDLMVTVLGVREPLTVTGRGLSHESFRLDRSCPRLLLPVLEQASHERTHYALVLVWGPIHDLYDVLETTYECWWNKLLIGSTERLLPELGGLANWLEVRPINQYIQEKERQRIQADVNAVLERSLSLRTLDEWQQAMRPHLPPDIVLTRIGLRDYLSELSQQLDQLPDEHHTCDVARKLGCGILWLATWDMSTTVELLECWMAAPSEAPQPPLGWSYTLMLLKVFLGRPVSPPARDQPATQSFRGFRRRSTLPKDEVSDTAVPSRSLPIPPLPPVESFSPFLRLAPQLAKSHYGYGVSHVLEWVRRWVHDEDWAKQFRLGGELFEMLEQCPASWRDTLLERFRRWREPREAWGEKTPPSRAVQLAHAMTRHLLIGRRKVTPELKPENGLFVVLLDAADPNSKSRKRHSIIVQDLCRFHKRWARQYPGLFMITYRLGENSPAVLPFETPAAETIAPSPLAANAPLAMPILESLPRDRIRGVLLLAERWPFDAEDFLDSWKLLGKIYCQRPGSFGPAPAWELIDPVKRPVEEITRRFTLLLKGSTDDE